MSGCPILTPNEFKDQYTNIVQYIYWKTCQCYRSSYAEKLKGHHPEAILEGREVTIHCQA